MESSRINSNVNFNYENENIFFDFDVLDGKLNILIKEKTFIGRGAYGSVYYIGIISGINSVIKINKSDNKFNEFEYEAYFYRKYNMGKLYNFNDYQDRSLPFLLDYGKTKNKIDNKIYDYMIIEYVGINNLYSILKTSDIDYGEKLICKMIFNCLYNHLQSFHKSNLIYRDVNPTNIVLSDNVTSFLISKSYSFSEKINKNFLDLIPKKNSIENIIKKYIGKSYGNIVKFVDGGMFGDVDYIYNNATYTRNNYFFYGAFPEFNMLDGMFASTIYYISPFCLFNLSSIINIYKEDRVSQNIRNLVINILRISDIWSLCILYAIHIHDTNNVKLSYKSIINSKFKKNPKTYSEIGSDGTNENTINYMPFYVSCNNKIILVKELMDILDLDKKIMHIDYDVLRENISIIINEILSLANLILSYSIKQKINYILHFDENIINILYKESLKKINFIHNTITKFDKILCEELIEYTKTNNFLY